MHGYSTLSMLMVRMCYVMYDRFVRVQRIINTKPQLIFVLSYILRKFNAFALMSSCFATVFSVSNTSQMFIKALDRMYWRLFLRINLCVPKSLRALDKSEKFLFSNHRIDDVYTETGFHSALKAVHCLL